MRIGNLILTLLFIVWSNISLLEYCNPSSLLLLCSCLSLCSICIFNGWFLTNNTFSEISVNRGFILHKSSEVINYQLLYSMPLLSLTLKLSCLPAVIISGYLWFGIIKNYALQTHTSPFNSRSFVYDYIILSMILCYE